MVGSFDSLTFVPPMYISVLYTPSRFANFMLALNGMSVYGRAACDFLSSGKKRAALAGSSFFTLTVNCVVAWSLVAPLRFALPASLTVYVCPTAPASGFQTQ